MGESDCGSAVYPVFIEVLRGDLPRDRLHDP